LDLKEGTHAREGDGGGGGRGGNGHQNVHGVRRGVSGVTSFALKRNTHRETPEGRPLDDGERRVYLTAARKDMAFGPKVARADTARPMRPDSRPAPPRPVSWAW
jgi:hypothetical protein